MVREFTQEQLDDSIVWYNHDGSESMEDRLVMDVIVIREVSNNSLQSYKETLDIGIVPVNDQPVNVSMFDSHLEVTQALLHPLLADDFHLHDPDSVQEDVTIEVLLEDGETSPFVVDGEPRVEFQNEDIQAGEVSFQASDELGNSTYELSISDGTHSVEHVLHILTIEQVLEVTSSPLAMLQGDKAIPLQLNTHIAVNTNSEFDEVIFNVSVPPMYGTLLLVGSEEPVETFTLEELRSGLVQYSQEDISQSSDQFQLTPSNRFRQVSPLQVIMQVQALMPAAAPPIAFSFDDEFIPVNNLMDLTALRGKAEGEIKVSVQQSPLYGGAGI